MLPAVLTALLPKALPLLVESSPLDPRCHLFIDISYFPPVNLSVFYPTCDRRLLRPLYFEKWLPSSVCQLVVFVISH